MLAFDIVSSRYESYMCGIEINIFDYGIEHKNHAKECVSSTLEDGSYRVKIFLNKLTFCLFFPLLIFLNILFRIMSTHLPQKFKMILMKKCIHYVSNCGNIPQLEGT